MARPATGSVVTRPNKHGTTYAIRFRAYGERHYETLGTSAEGWTYRRAEEALQERLADVRRGLWRPPEAAPTPPEPKRIPTFHEFASDWLEARRPELRDRTVRDYEWALSYHLLPFFAEMRLDAITVEEVDRYRAMKVREGKLSPGSINKTLKRLAQILELAVDYGYLPRNPASSQGGRRRVKEPKPRRAWIEPEQFPALLDACQRHHRPIIATLAGAGLRVGEAVALDWRDVNLGTGTIRVRRSKTDAGTDRVVDMPLGLREILTTHKATSAGVGPRDPVFVTRGRNGQVRRQTADNVGRRLKTAIRRANVALEEAGIEPISERVSPHSLRRLYASLRAALGDDPVYIAEQLGHEDPTFTFRVYQKAAKRRERLSGAYLEAFDRALEWALLGTNAHLGTSTPREGTMSPQPQTASASGKAALRPRSSAG